MTEDNKRKEHYIKILIMLVILMLIIILFLLVRIIGKIGYVETSANAVSIIDVSENDIGWDLLENLSIFNNVKYDNKNIIAPGSYGKYSFIVANRTNQSIIYEVQLRELNDYNINMKYKLKLENIYVSGTKEEWKDVQDVNLESVILAPESMNLYTLEWCWVNNDEQDTKIGMLDYADYTLRMKIGAQLYGQEVGEVYEDIH